MRIRRTNPQKPLTEDQKARAVEAQKQVQKLNGGPLTANQAYQNYPSAAPSMMQRFQTNMRQNPFMRNRMTFEEKYGVVKNATVEGTVIDQSALETINTVDDEVVPPSLEENAEQGSPLPPGVVNASEVSDLDEYIKQAEELQKDITPKAATIQEENGIELQPSVVNRRDIYEGMDLKGLKAIYTELGGTRDISHNNNKKNIINLILELEANGSQKEEEPAISGDTESSDAATTNG